MQINLREWIISIFAIFGGFVSCGLAGAILSDVLNLWDIPVIGFFAAFSVVSVAYLAAPHHAKIFALVIYFVGSLVAFYLLRNEFYPESYEQKAYLQTWWPLVITLLGGLVPLSLIWLGGKRA